MNTKRFLLTACASCFVGFAIPVATIRADVAGAVKPAPAPKITQPAPGEKPERPAIAPPRSIYDQEFDRAYKKKTEGWLEDPLKFIHSDMTQSHGELAAYKTDKPVQKVQEQAVSRLDTIIKMLEKECSGGGNSSSANPTKPLAKSVLTGGPGGQGDMHDPKAGEKEWAKLSPKEREKILQSRTEGFPPGFESVLQSYYERLAQEQVEDTRSLGTTDAAPLSPAPAPSTPAKGNN